MINENKTEPAILDEIWQLKDQLKNDLLILGHHYQRDEVIQYADKTGDSFELARQAAQNRDKKYIIFCGVHFMAETADILTTDEQSVIIPDVEAGCPMADMAWDDGVYTAWDELKNVIDEKIIPITYMNSTAAIKSFVGANDGIVCTSSNAEKALKWAFKRGNKVLFIPDQHLGRNTAFDMGIPLEQMVVWNPEMTMGGNKPSDIKQAKMILWQGHCYVHQQFLPEDIDNFRSKYPEGKVIVHPECMFETARKADLTGSTSKIIKVIEAAPEGSVWAVGTERNLVERLQKQNMDKKIVLPSALDCKCGNMFKISPSKLLKTMRLLAKGEVINKISVDKEIQQNAKIALQRMLEL
ncbi:MAG: quinolinate synthase NadA [Calditrichia bacterium]|nr:quinolinate synthase NadA [Calditrichia bacterium]